jgi:hypothetical protein
MRTRKRLSGKAGGWGSGAGPLSGSQKAIPRDKKVKKWAMLVISERCKKL